MAARLEAEKFTSNNDFGVWRMKMRAMLTQQGLATALDPKPKDQKERGVLDEKAMLKQAEIEAKAHSMIVLCLADKVLREVAKETTAAGILTSYHFCGVQSAIRAKEIHKGGLENGARPSSSMAESLNVKHHKFKKPFKKDQDVSKAGQADKKETRSSHWCKKPGHLKKDCYAWKKKQAQAGKKMVNATDCVEDSDMNQILNVMDNGIGGSWIMDSGCSFHMSSNLMWFEELDEHSGIVILGNNQVCYVKGISTIRLKMQDGCIRVLTEVRYIPQVKRNLISLGLLERKGCVFSSAGGKMVVTKNSKVMMEAERRCSLYYLLSEVQIAAKAEVNSISEGLKLWHKRLGHPAEGSIRELVKSGVMQAQLEVDHLRCEECVLENQRS